jgi:hypothetical protein
MGDTEPQMKATISEPESSRSAVWEGEAISADWNRRTGEFVISGDAEDAAFATVVASIAEKQTLTIGIEDDDSAQLVWRGCVGSARFDTVESGNVQCHLVLTLDDWFGIFPGFSSFYFA